MSEISQNNYSEDLQYNYEKCMKYTDDNSL